MLRCMLSTTPKSLPYLGSTPSKRLGLGQFVNLGGRCREVHSGLLVDLGAQCDISCGLKCLLRRKSGGNCVRPRRWRERNSGRRENGCGKKAELGHLHSDASEVNLFEFYCFSVDMWIWQRAIPHQQCWTCSAETKRQTILLSVSADVTPGIPRSLSPVLLPRCRHRHVVSISYYRRRLELRSWYRIAGRLIIAATSAVLYLVVLLC